MAQGIKVENLTKIYHSGGTDLLVLDHTSFQIDKGEFVALVAPSGAGKTTLLMMIGCVLEPTGGKIWLGEEKVWDEDHWSIKDTRKIRREKIGFIFQQHYLIPFLNVLENVILIPLENGVSKESATAKARELLTYFDIADKERAMPSELSGGQNQRVAIARALANEPQIILADEPTASLDMERAIDVVKMLKKLAVEQHVAVIMVTHDERLLPYCDRVLTIKNKKVLEEKSVGKIV